MNVLQKTIYRLYTYVSMSFYNLDQVI